MEPGLRKKPRPGLLVRRELLAARRSAINWGELYARLGRAGQKDASPTHPQDPRPEGHQTGQPPC